MEELQNDEAIEKMWNSWSEQSVASIFLDAQRINGVFGSIKQQLDYLRENQSKLAFDFQALTSGFMPSTNSQSKIQEPSTSKTLPSFSFGGLVTQEDFSLLRDEVDSLRQELRSKSDIDQRIQKIEQVMNSTHRELAHKVDVLMLQLSNANLEIAANHDKFITFQSDNQVSMENFRKEMEEKFLALEINGMQIGKDTDLKLNQMKDIISIQELKVKQLEAKLNNSIETLAELSHSFENFPRTHLESIHQQLQELLHEKADRNELNQKADLIIAISKADQSDFLNLQGFIEELERRFLHDSTEMGEKLKSIEQKLNHRSDRIVSWCMKQLRKELKSMNINETDHREGTDIGKVRCLVCDQVTSQQRFVTDTVFGGPEFHQTIKGLHRGRSASPSPGSNDHSPVRKDREKSPGNKGHSRLVGLGQSPYEGQYYNQNDPQFYGRQLEDPDYMADFKYRASMDASNHPTHERTQSNNVTKLPPATATRSQSTPLIQITSVQHPDGNNYGKYPPPNTEPVVNNHLQDIDRIIHSKVGSRTTNNNKKIGYLQKNRPVSAPSKRTTVPSKLKPLGKTVPEEEPIHI